MANRTGFDFVQETIGRSLNKFADYFSNEPFFGIKNQWFTLYTSVFGSLDYFHLVAFPLSGMYNYNHPMYLSGVSDGATFGYINADLTNQGKESHLIDNSIFDIDWAPCPDGNETYPPWDGWPEIDHSLPDYPVDGITRMFVFLKGMMIKVESSIVATFDNTFIINASRILSESLRPDDYYDIRVYRYDDATNHPSLGWIPSGSIYELNRSIVGSNLVVQVGRNVGEDIPINVGGEPRFFMVYWESPDNYCATSTPVTTTPNDVTAFLTFNDGNTPVARELFDTKRYDILDFKNEGNKYLKSFYTTRYSFIDGDSEHYDDPNPIFYSLPAMRGSLDPLHVSDMPGIGNMWGYGYSMDQGVSNPPDGMLQGILICYQASAGNATDMQVITGPLVPPEFQPDNLNEFEWYPPLLDQYTLMAKLIVRVINSNHLSSYRPETIIEYLEYIPSYGKEKIDNALYFSYMQEYLSRNAFLVNYLDTLLASILLPIIYITPVTNSRIGGMQNNALYILDMESVFSIFNTYWKIPVQHPLIASTSIVPVDSVNDYINQKASNEYGQLEFNQYIRQTLAQNSDFQLSTILGTFYSDDNNLEFGIKCYNNKKIYIPKKLEIHAPIINSCHNYSEVEKTKYDYTFRFKMRSARHDTIQKDLFISASKYYITNDEASTLVSRGLNEEEYLWPAKLSTINNWNMYGRTVLIPDLVGGENATIEMKQFKPRDESLPLYSEFLATLQEQYYNDLNSGDPVRVKRANEAILDAVTDQEYLYGGFDEPDTRTLNNLISSLDEFLMSISLYNATAIPYWDSTIDFWGGDAGYFDINTGAADPRYGFQINANWYYQNFNEITVSNARRTYIEEHPENFYILQEQVDDTGIPNPDFALNGSYYALSTTFMADFADVYNKVYSVKLKLKLNNVPNAKLVLTINNTDGSKIPTDILQISNTVDYTALSSDFEWIEFSFANPISLVDNTRYALVLSAEDPLNTFNGVDSINTIQWAFASTDTHAYGITDINSLLTNNVSIGDNNLLVVDGSVYSAAPFYIKIGAEVFEVLSVSGNYLNISGNLQNSYSASTPVYEVVYVPSDSEVRWRYVKNGELYNWESTLNQNYDATYQLYRKTDNIGLVTLVPPDEWSGSDLSASKSEVDAFYICESTDSYTIPGVDDGFNPMFYGTLPGLSPFAGFNVANSYDFPPVNTWRAGYTNLVDGVISLSSKEIEKPSQFSVYPLAINNAGVVQYLPTKHDIYITAICKLHTGQKKVVNKLIPAGTSSPVLLDSSKFIGIDLLWVDKSEFKEDPFYGYGPAESFVIRSI